MRDLTWDDFREAVGTVYSVVAPDALVALRLDSAEPFERSIREGGAFRLGLVGPVDPVLSQATYRFEADGVEPFEMFIVPVARDGDGTRYEAIFY